MGMDQLRLLEKHGVDPKNVLLCHIDSKMDTDYAIRLCREGATIAWTMLAENCRIAIPFACGWSRRWWRPAA